VTSYGSERLADYIIIVRGAVRVVRIDSEKGWRGHVPVRTNLSTGLGIHIPSVASCENQPSTDGQGISILRAADQGVFALGQTFIENLITALSRFDFAVLILTPDDFVQCRSTEAFGPRDNIIFELGLFMGRLGRDRTFILQQSGSGLKIPTDLSGVTTSSYDWPREDKNYKAAVATVSEDIRDRIQSLGKTRRFFEW
jgi:predicted nucleotide-binding protein with TIR-like domain